MEDEHIHKVFDAYVNRKDIERFAHVATMEEIIENGYNLNIPRYVDTFEPEEEIDITEVTKNIENIDKEIAESEKIIKDYFSQLGIAFPGNL